MKWISTRDKLPEINHNSIVSLSDPLLCILTDNTFHVLQFTDAAKTSFHPIEDEWRSLPGKYSVKHKDVTHWMPLPLPPEKIINEVD